MSAKPDYIKTYEEFWKDILEDDVGNLNKDALMRELYDFHVLLEQVPIVYEHISGGATSKPHVDAVTMITLNDNRIAEIIKDKVEEFNAELDASADGTLKMHITDIKKLAAAIF